LAQEGLLLIEWPERLGVHVKEFSKQALLRIMITTITDNKRRIRIDGFSPEIEDRITQDWRAKA
jgi:tRNA A37 threonylcarbamoyladenosine biosynthesis protein TsaE